MAELTRTTVYLKPALRRALKVKAALTDQSLSDLVNDAIEQSLREDELDRRTLRKRRREKGRPYEDFVKELKRDGLL